MNGVQLGRMSIMRTEESCLYLNHSPERSGAPAAAVAEMKQWRPDFNEERPDSIDTYPNRELKGGTGKKAGENYTINEGKDEEGRMLRQGQEHNSSPLTNDLHAPAPDSARNMSRSQIDASNNSSTGSEKLDKKKRRVEPNEEDANNRPYECRFCEMKFTKSQALGGHMNGHRQERERDQLQQAHKLLYNNMHNNIQQGGSLTSVFPSSGIHLSRFNQWPSSLPSQFSGTQEQQQGSIYHQSPLAWSQGSSTTPYAHIPDATGFAVEQDGWSSLGRSTAYAAPLNNMSYLSHGRSQDLQGSSTTPYAHIPEATGFSAEQDGRPSLGRSTAYAAPLNDMSYLSQGWNQDLQGMSFERNTQLPSNLFPSEPNTTGVLPMQRSGFLQGQGSGLGAGAGAQSSSSVSGLTERGFNSTFHHLTSYTFLDTEYNHSNAEGDNL